jgi:hypothetical protein
LFNRGFCRIFTFSVSAFGLGVTFIAIFIAIFPALFIDGYLSPAAAAQAESNGEIETETGGKIQDPNAAYRQAVSSLNLQTEPGPFRNDPVVNAPKPGKKLNLPVELLGIPAFIFLALVSWSLIRHFRRSRAWKTKIAESAQASAPDPQALEKIRDQADLLAGQGLYTAAMHKLLLNTIEEIKNQTKLTLPQSFTSREIVKNLGLDQPQTTILGQIVSKVELCWFGNHQPQKEDYLACRAIFQSFQSLLANASPLEQAAEAKGRGDR